jgi:nickel-dependent lactate racemase
LPEHLNIDQITYIQEPGIAESAQSNSSYISEALNNPVGSPPLKEIAKNKNNAVILISDRSRLSPSHLFLSDIVNQLNSAGIEDSHIKIIVALGMHRKQTQKELMELAGESIYQRVEVLNHSADPQDCVHLGITSHGTPIEINHHVVQADLRIATGNIEPHRLAGMSGGVKALIPGVASSNCIEHNHALSQKFKTVPGDIHNPVHQDMEEGLQFISINYLLNVIVDHNRDIMGAVSGNVIEAHRAGIELAKKCFFVPVSDRYDFVLASPGGFPKDLQLYQAIKTLQNAASITKLGGSILFTAKCEELFGNGIFQYWVETMGEAVEIVQRLKEKFVLGAHKIEHIYEVTKNHKVYLHSDVPESLIELLGFHPVHDVQSTLEELTENINRIAVMPHGAITFPQIQQN